MIDDSYRPATPYDLRAPFLPISRKAAHEVKSASLTLAVISRFMAETGSPQCFVSVGKIARRTGRSTRSVSSDLTTLDAKEWILNVGRQRSNLKAKRVRRTNTILLTDKARDHAEPYHRLPEWALGFLPRWSDCLVYAAVVNVALYVRDKGIEGYNRERFSLTSLCKATGLSRPTVIDAKHRLEHAGFLTIENGGDSDYLFVVDPPAPSKVLALRAVKNLRPEWSNSCSRIEEALLNKHSEEHKHAGARIFPRREEVA